MNKFFIKMVEWNCKHTPMQAFFLALGESIIIAFPSVFLILTGHENYGSIIAIIIIILGICF